MTTVPESLPTLAAGAHAEGKGKACVMEYISMLAGEAFSDHPKCTHPALATVARTLNDMMSDSQRHELVPLIGRLFGTNDTSKKTSYALARYAAKRAWGFLDTAESGGAYLHTATAAERANDAVRHVAASDDAWAAASWSAHAATYAVSAAGNAAPHVAYVCSDGSFTYEKAALTDHLKDLLTGMLDEYDRVTGRTETHNVSDEELLSLAVQLRERSTV
jgi:hypothetical protein